jgi:hypothetical protein
MNERILKLAKQSGMRSPDLFKLTVSHMSTDTLEKFAELIVRECIDVGIKDFYNHLPNIFPANAIKKHFGVEE